MSEQIGQEQKEFDLQLFASAYLRGDEYELLELQQPLGVELTSLFNKVAKLPNPLDAKIIAAFTMLPSLLCKVVPILVLRGQAGSGKSQILTTMADLLNTNTMAGNSTPASVKNHVNRLRWADPETLQHERNCHLLMDNCNQDTFDHSDILGAFLNGYWRKTDRQYISGGKGQNIEFRVFCPKAITTVHDIESQEMLRRILTIRTKKYRDLDGIGEELPELPTLKKEVGKFWNSPSNCAEFVMFRRSAELKWHKGCPLSKEQLHLVADLIAAGCAAGVWSEPLDGLMQLAQMFQQDAGRVTRLEAVVLDALETLTVGQPIEGKTTKQRWEELVSIGVNVEVTPKNLKLAIQEQVDNGLISRPSLSKVEDILAKNGFVPVKSASGFVYKFKVK